MKRPLDIGVDVDEVVADLLQGCCDLWNAANGSYIRSALKSRILPEDLRGWDLSPYFGEGWQNWLTTPEFYKNYVKPVQGARVGINRLREAGHRIIYISSCVPGSTNQKQQWLIDWGFLPAERAVKDFCAWGDKAKADVDVLFDDGIHNVEAFPRAAYLVNHWHNIEEKTTRPRIQGVIEALETLRRDGLA